MFSFHDLRHIASKFLPPAGPRAFERAPGPPADLLVRFAHSWATLRIAVHMRYAAARRHEQKLIIFELLYFFETVKISYFGTLSGNHIRAA